MSHSCHRRFIRCTEALLISSCFSSIQLYTQFLRFLPLVQQHTCLLFCRRTESCFLLTSPLWLPKNIPYVKFYFTVFESVDHCSCNSKSLLQYGTSVLYVNCSRPSTKEAFLDNCCICLFSWCLTYNVCIRKRSPIKAAQILKNVTGETQLSVDKNQHFSSKPPNIFHPRPNEEPWVRAPALYLMSPQRQKALLLSNLFSFSLQNSCLSSSGFTVLHSFELHGASSRFSFIRSFTFTCNESNCLFSSSKFMEGRVHLDKFGLMDWIPPRQVA